MAVNLKKILETFVELKEDEKATKVHQPNKNVAPETVKGTYEKPLNQEAPNLNSSGSEVSFSLIEERLKKVLEEENRKNFPGADYYEFELALDNMKEVPDERTRYSSAFNILSATQSLTKDHLVETAKEYITVLDREINEFNAGFNKEHKLQIEDKQALITQKTNEMQVLSQKIADLNNEIKKVSQEVADSKTKLAVTQNAFKTVAESQKQKINSELDKINTYIK